MSGNGPDGDGSVDVTYSGGNDTYDGTLNAQTPIGQVQVDVSCSLKGVALFVDENYFKYKPVLMFRHGVHAAN